MGSRIDAIVALPDTDRAWRVQSERGPLVLRLHGEERFASHGRGAMSTAVLSLEAFQERQLRDRFRARAHEALDELLNRLEARMTEPGSSPPTLMDLTEAVSQQRSVFTSALVGALLAARRGGLPPL